MSFMRLGKHVLCRPSFDSMNNSRNRLAHENLLIRLLSFLQATRAAAVAAAGPVMRTRNCDLTGKSANRKARVVTFSHTRIHKVS
jgi:hypothetical protein